MANHDQSTDAHLEGDIDRRQSHLTDHLDYLDLDFRAVFQFLVGLFGIVVVSYFIIWGMLEFFEANYGPDVANASPVADTEWDEPAVDLQTAPNLDLVEYEEEQLEVLDDPTDGGVSIEEAMESVVADGLPYRNDQMQEGSADVVDAESTADADGGEIEDQSDSDEEE